MMKDAGVHVVQALEVSPFWRIFLRRLDLRQHRKIIVIDEPLPTQAQLIWLTCSFQTELRCWSMIIASGADQPTVNVLSAIQVGIGKLKRA